jgi:hypothetical protein
MVKIDIFNELLWPHFIQLNEIRLLPVNEQVNRYNEYVNELSKRRNEYISWLEGESRGSILPSQPTQNTGSFLLQENNFKILQEDFSNIIIY